MLIKRPDLIRAAFAHPDLVPPPAGPGSAFWLRTRVARFSHGPSHARRRALATSLIESIDPSAASSRAAALVRAGTPIREAVVRALDLVPSDAVDLVLEVAPAYFDPSVPAPSLDTLVSRLRASLSPRASTSPGAVGGENGEGGLLDDEAIAARIGVLVQACDATAALVEARMHPRGRTTKRLALRDVELDGARIPAGTTVTLELGEMIFGAPPRECPGRGLAVAVAEAIIEELP
jgi:cytochrome P450